MDKNNTFNQFYTWDIIQNYEPIIEHLFNKTYNVNQTGVTNRVIRHWTTEELLIERPEKREWRKFSFIEYCWIKIIDEMRQYNIPFEIIKQLKEEIAVPFDPEIFKLVLDDSKIKELAEVIPENERDDFIAYLHDHDMMREVSKATNFSILFSLIIYSIASRTNLSIMINKKGKVYILNESFLDAYKKDEDFLEFYHGSYLSVSITEIIKDVIKEFYQPLKVDLQKNSTTLEIALVTREEARVLEIIRERRYKSIYIRFNDNKEILRIEATEEKKIDPLARFVDFIYSGEYNDITIKTKDKTVLYFENTRKFKL